MAIMKHAAAYWNGSKRRNLCLEEELMIMKVGMFGMRKFRYRYTGKNILVIPVYRYFGLVKS